MSDLVQITRCKICQHGFDEGIPIIGESEQDRVGRKVQALNQHLTTHHPQVIHEVMFASQTFMTFLVLSMFELTDPRIEQSRVEMRSMVNKFLHGERKPEDAPLGNMAKN